MQRKVKAEETPWKLTRANPPENRVKRRRRGMPVKSPSAMRRRRRKKMRKRITNNGWRIIP